MEKCNEELGYTIRNGFDRPECEMTVYVHDGDMTPFRLTRENVRNLLKEVIEANPHLHYSYEKIDTFEEYRHSIDYYMSLKSFDGFSYHKMAGEMIWKLENWCKMSFDLPYNPYWQMTEEQVLEIENIMRSELGLEPVEKMLRK